MASNHPGLTKVGTFWHYNLKINGQRAHGSTRAKDLATAKKILDEKRKELLVGQHRIVSRVPTLAAVFEAWHRNHVKVFSPTHLSSFVCIFRKWIEPSLGTRLADRITIQDALQIREAQAGAGCSPRYMNNTLIVIKTLHNYARTTGLIRSEPLRIKPLRIQRKPRAVIVADQMGAFLAAVKSSTASQHVRLMIFLMVGLGLRENEVRGMRWEWLDIWQRTYVVGRAKGKEARVLPVPEWLWNALEAHPHVNEEWIFPAKDGKPHRAQVTKKALAKVAEALKLPRLTAHRLRATFASLHALAGTPATEIQAMLGHKSMHTTMLYLEHNQDARRRAQESLWDGLGMDQQS